MEKNNNIRIIDIARLANVSVGTVDRVLHKRGRVSEEKRLAVEKVLKEINYEPNMFARMLASKKNFNFAVLMPSFVDGEYWQLVYEGILKAENELKDFNVRVDFVYFNQFDEVSFISATHQVLDGEYAGVVIPTLHKQSVIALAKHLDELEIPYVFIDSNIADCNNIAYFGCDSISSGAIAAKLLLKEIGLDADIAIVQGKSNEYIRSTQGENREKGFVDYLATNNYKGKIHYLYLSATDDNNSLKEFLQTRNPKGVITFNSKIYEIVEFFRSIDKQRKIYFIGYDSIRKNIELLLKDEIAYLISQRSIKQGYESIRALSNEIFHTELKKENYMSIDILIKENVCFYND